MGYAPKPSLFKIAGEYSNLPALNPLDITKVRSTWATILAILASLSPLLGGGIGEFVTMILANASLIEATGEELIAGINSIIGALGIIWLWFERRDPNFRLTLKK